MSSYIFFFYLNKNCVSKVLRSVKTIFFGFFIFAKEWLEKKKTNNKMASFKSITVFILWMIYFFATSKTGKRSLFFLFYFVD